MLMRMPLVIKTKYFWASVLTAPPPCLVKACLKKAQYLLKFAKVQLEDTISSSLVRRTWATKGKHWQKVSTAVNTVEKLKQQVNKTLVLSATTIISEHYQREWSNFA